MKRLEIHIDAIYGTDNFSVQIDDHCLQQTKILDNAYNNIDDANNASQDYIKNKIGLRRQLGDEQSSKLSPSASKTECVGSIPTRPAQN